jgi:hypothetical protein
MKIHQRNKLNMYVTVLQFLAENTAVWAAFIAFGNAVTLLIGKVAALQEQVAIQATHIVGYAVTKRIKKNNLAEKVYEVCGALKAYATLIGDNVLYDFADYTLTELKKQPDNVLTQTANNMYNKANSLVGSLGDYGIDAAYLTAFQTQIADYVSFVESPRLARIARKTATVNIKLLIKEIDAILKNQLDMLILPIKVLNPDFFIGYDSAKMILDIGHHHLPLILVGTVNSGQILNVINTSNPRWFAGVKVKIKNTGTVSMFFYLSDTVDGGYPGTGGTLLAPGEEETHIITEGEFKNFLNIQNQSVNEGTFEVSIS